MLPHVAHRPQPYHHHHHHHLPGLVGPDHSNYLRALQQSALRIYIPGNSLLSRRNRAGSVVYLLQRRIITSCDNIAGSLGVHLPRLKYPRTRKIKTLETMGFGQELRNGSHARPPEDNKSYRRGFWGISLLRYHLMTH